MVVKDNMVEIENEVVATSGATDARKSVTKMQLMELKMRISKCVEEDKMMFAVKELGCDGLEWFVGLEKKPSTWEEMKKMLFVKFEEDEAIARKNDEEIKRDLEIKKKVEEEVMKRLNEVKFMYKSNNMRNISETRNKSNKINNGEEIKCYKCGMSGHIAIGCRIKRRSNRQGDDNLNKKEFDYLGKKDIEYKINYCEKENNKRIKLTIEKLVEDYADVFVEAKRNGKIEFCEVEKCRINTREGEKIVKRGQRVPQSLKQKTRELLEDLENRGIKWKSESQWRNPIRALEKPNGEIRLVVNLMAFNDLTEKDSFTLPDMRRLIQATAGSKYITVLDLKEVYYQIEIVEEHKHKTAFEFESNVYEWNGMVMGYKNAPMILQRVMSKVLN
jgi:hypothetical protein